MEPTATELLLAWIGEHPLETGLALAALSLLVAAAQLLPGRARQAAVPEPREAPPIGPAVPLEPAVEEPTPAVRAEPAVEKPTPAVRAEPAVEEPTPAVRAEPAVEKPTPPVRLGERLRKTSEALVGRLGAVASGRKVDAELLDELEMLLMSADLGVKTADDLLQAVRAAGGASDGAALRGVLRAAILEKLKRVELEPGTQLDTRGKPHVVLVLGVNGSGKTTTIGKLAARHVAAGRKVILGAGDTFRAAAIDQLQVWGQRAGCEVVAGQPGGDPAAVAFDTVKAALARDADVAIIDTAGRLQTKKPLMEELGKLVRVIGRNLEGAPHETLLVLDANTGQNAISQAQLFTEVAGVTGIALTKLDGTAKGGVIVGLADEFGIPVKHVGVGEAVEDLRDFQAEEFVDALFG